MSCLTLTNQLAATDLVPTAAAHGGYLWNGGVLTVSMVARWKFSQKCC